jgi:hypothetical protein
MSLLKRTLLGGAIAAVLSFSAPVQAAEYLGKTKGECQGQGGFTNCFATKTGDTGDIVKGPLAEGVVGSPTIVKYDGSGSLDTISTNFASIDGSEIQLMYDALTDVLSFTYTPDANDPEIHFFSIKQGNETALFYDATAILTGSIDLDEYFSKGSGYSHITFYDTKAAGGTDPDGGTGGVPEPGTWAMMLIGFGGMGVAMRRRRRNGNMLSQAA